MKKLFSIIFFIINFFIYNSSKTFAITEFSTDFRSEYTVTSRGVAEVTHQIKITNNLSHIYTTEYAIQVGSTHLDNVQATSKGKSLPVKVDSTDSSSMIKVSIINPAIGLGAVTEINLSYNTTDIAEKLGSNWEINIPRLAKANEATFYSRKLIIPKSMGEPTIISPAATTISDDEDSRIYEFVGYTRDSISLLIGKTASYKLNLTYHIKNPTLTGSNTEIALPPDTEYQRILIDKLDPPPKEVKLDQDGNWLAVYNLKSQESKTISASLYATISPTPTYDLTLPISNSLTKSTKYWQTESATVKNLSSKFRSAKDVYSYLTDNLSYDYRRVGKRERLGAEKALEDPTSAICTEYTDSFIALTRELKIPSREINGFAYTDNQALKPTGSEDILHAWPSYYDDDHSLWIQVDPTWGSTTGGVDYLNKLDYSHIAFVIHGQETDYPIPAGAYKENENDKTLDVSLTDSVPIASPLYKINKSGTKIEVVATGNVALHNQKIKVGDQEYTVSYLPPYGTQIFDNAPKNTSWLEKLLTFFKSILN